MLSITTEVSEETVCVFQPSAQCGGGVWQADVAITGKVFSAPAVLGYGMLIAGTLEEQCKMKHVQHRQKPWRALLPASIKPPLSMWILIF